MRGQRSLQRSQRNGLVLAEAISLGSPHDPFCFQMQQPEIPKHKRMETIRESPIQSFLLIPSPVKRK